MTFNMCCHTLFTTNEIIIKINGVLHNNNDGISRSPLSQSRIVVAENLPEDHCYQNLMKIFSAVGRYLLTIRSEIDCAVYNIAKRNEAFEVYFIVQTCDAV